LVFRDGEPIPLPELAAWVFAEREVASVTVSILSGTVTANCHFFGDLELDVDPREVTSAAAFDSGSHAVHRDGDPPVDVRSGGGQYAGVRIPPGVTPG
jgi:hypothetical protein